MNDKPAATVPSFNFDPINEPPKPDHTAEVVRTREAFAKADYLPPDMPKLRGKGGTVPKPKASRKKSDSKEAPDTKPPGWRRPRGRPVGVRQHRISMKTTEDHLAFMYVIADGRELVGAFEHALEALAREVIASNTYESRPVPEYAMTLARSLADKSGQTP